LPPKTGERLHGWWIAGREPALGHLLFCHGNAGNIGDRVLNAALLMAAGFDVLLFDYRGYGHSTGRPDEQGTYRDAHAALAALLARQSVDRDRVFYLGESLGGAVALALAVECPPRGLILQSTFTSIRDAARAHYPFIPTVLTPDAYPSLRPIRRLRAPLLVLHGDRDTIVPLAHGRALFGAASEPRGSGCSPGWDTTTWSRKQDADTPTRSPAGRQASTADDRATPLPVGGCMWEDAAGEPRRTAVLTARACCQTDLS
jgi:fermentation-respiration switch protein FrsA (DUF1100 family)